MNDLKKSPESPPWSSTTKLVVGLTFVAVIAALLVNFRAIIGPLLLAGIFAFVLHPFASTLSKATHFSWRASVNLVFLLVVIILGIAVTLSGLAVIQQLQSLVIVVQRFVTNLPTLAEEFSSGMLGQVYLIGPFRLDLSSLVDVTAFTDQLLGVLQPLVGRVGNLVGLFAARAGITMAWGLFILVVSYFVLADAGEGVPEALLSLEIPGYQEDLRRFSRELGRIWDAFLRGQLILFVIAVICYQIVMSILGVRFAMGLAILAGLARFVPYIGPLVTWIVIFLVAVLQESFYLQQWLSSLQYALLVLGAAVVLDWIFDNLLAPRLLGSSLGVHPAAMLVAAIIAASLIGLVGILMAAPVLATLQLFGRYAVRKMFDLDPWQEPEEQIPPISLRWLNTLSSGWHQVRKLRKKGVDHVEENP